MNFYKIYSAKPYLFLVNDWTLQSDNLLRLRCSVLQRISKLIMTIDYKLRDEEKLRMILVVKQQKYQYYHQVKLINMTNKSQMIKQAKFAY